MRGRRRPPVADRLAVVRRARENAAFAEAGDRHDVLPLVRARALRASRGGRLLWSDLSFDLHAQSSIAVTGPSGSGKTSLLHRLGLLAPVDAGSLQIAGEDVTCLTSGVRRRLFRGTVGHLFQDYALVDEWTVRRNVDVAALGWRMPRRRRSLERARALGRVGLAASERRQVHTLSGGEQQRVALARLVLRQPRLVVADEPTAALDDDNVSMVLSVLDELRTGGAVVVVATHDERVVDWCDRRLDLGPATRSGS